ncbi:MotA/TolQ/ExbB proton channel family protein [Aurantiacibacter luteus]|uniref:MotA/TolQ/ExbB proton channel domain-containing protein n=1 Tax=Aurantiacibacter luteus TaxID=1581420 RepID=A0A0G9MPM6_9SPHN|nr:MotA/TolQ/ExbB proton channel family protein [Aurantiacibacter luteus]KLE31248.1 hypothetical protein AAW00_13870 [Aurantiacibacter luteus]
MDAFTFSALLDPASLAVVLGGTLLATLLRCGRTGWQAAAGAATQLLRPRFTYEHARAKVAAQVDEIRSDGVLRAHPVTSEDAEIDEATAALIKHRSIAALEATHQRHAQMRRRRRQVAEETLAQAGDLAPVFGLAGTLLALSQLPADGLASGDMAATVASAVLTTLYGLLCAHFVFYPLARLIERRAEQEEEERQHLFDWLSQQIAGVVPDGPAVLAGAAA